MRKVKKICVLSTALLACASAFGGVVAMNYASAAESIVIDGASVRMSDPTGIRFETLVEKKEGYTYGTLIIPKTLLNGRELDVNVGADALNVVAEKWNADNGGYTVVLGGANGENGITNFPMSKYNETLVACSYAEKEGVYTYSAPVEKTLAWVASMALADTTEEGAITNATQREFLEGICDYVIGEDAFVFAQEELLVVDKADLSTVYSQTNGADGLAAIWSVEGEGVTVDTNGEVTVSEGSATVTAKIGTKTASIVVKKAVNLSGNLTGAIDGAAKISLYDSTNEFIVSYDATVVNGTYTALVASDALENASKAIVSQLGKAAFIDEYNESKDGEMGVANIYGATTVNGVKLNSVGYTAYDELKAYANAKVTPAQVGKQMVVANSVTDGNYAYRVAVNTRTVDGKPKANGAAIALTSGNYYIQFLRYPSRQFVIEVYKGSDKLYEKKFGNPDDDENRLATTTGKYLTTTTKDSNTISGINAFGNLSDGSGSSFAYGFEKNADGIYISLGRADDNMFEVFKLTANGLEAADGAKVYTGGADLTAMTTSETQKTALNGALGAAYNTADVELLKAFASFFNAENAIFFTTADGYGNVPFTVEPLYKEESSFILSGKVTGATSATALSVYDKDGNFVSSHSDVFDNDGNYSLEIQSDEYNLIAYELGKAAFIDAGQTNGVLKNANLYGATTVNGVSLTSLGYTTYAELKARANAIITLAQSNKQMVIANSVTEGNYAYRVAINTRPDEGITGAPTNTNGTGVWLTNGDYSLRIIRYSPKKWTIELYQGSNKLYDKTFDNIAQNDTYFTMTSTNTSITSAENAFGNISDGSGSNYAIGFEKKADGIYISLGRENCNMFEVFKMTENGIEAAAGTKVYTGRNDVTAMQTSETQKAALNSALGSAYNTTNEELLKAFASFFKGENAIVFVSATANTPFTVGQLHE